MPEPCSEKCARYDARLAKKHARIEPDDPELQAALRSFAAWFYAAGQDIEGQIRYAAELYTRRDHTGTCIPKTILFAHYKHLQFDSSGEPLRLSDAARTAVNGEPVASWPDGEEAAGEEWGVLFARYGERYRPDSL